jgi:hypothetical protein
MDKPGFLVDGFSISDDRTAMPCRSNFGVEIILGFGDSDVCPQNGHVRSDIFPTYR